MAFDEFTKIYVSDKKDKEKLKRGGSTTALTRALLRIDNLTIADTVGFTGSMNPDNQTITITEAETTDATADIDQDEIIGEVRIGDPLGSGTGFFKLGLGNSTLATSKTNSSGNAIAEEIRMIDTDLGAGSVFDTINY